MKLVMSVINSDDTYKLTDALIAAGYRATVISTVGGFLREGNTTLLIGVPDESVGALIEIIRENCRTRSRYINPIPPIAEIEALYLATPVEVEVGGAVVFVLDTERFFRF